MVQNSKKHKKLKKPTSAKPKCEEINENSIESECNKDAQDEELPGNSEQEMETESNLNKQDADGEDDLDDEMDLGNLDLKPKKKKKKGIIYVSNIPKHMNVTRLKEILGVYGQIGRVYLQPEKLPSAGKDKKKKKKRFARHFTEGWVEFESKRVAKQIVEVLNNKQISTRKKSQFYDSLWSMKYLPRFKWVHLTERMNYEQAVHKQRLMTEVSQARKETTFFQNNLDKSEYLKKRNKKANKQQKDDTVS